MQKLLIVRTTSEIVTLLSVWLIPNLKPTYEVQNLKKASLLWAKYAAYITCLCLFYQLEFDVTIIIMTQHQHKIQKIFLPKVTHWSVPLACSKDPSKSYMKHKFAVVVLNKYKVFELIAAIIHLNQHYFIANMKWNNKMNLRSEQWQQWIKQQFHHKVETKLASIRWLINSPQLTNFI